MILCDYTPVNYPPVRLYTFGPYLFFCIYHFFALGYELLGGLPDQLDSLQGLALAGDEGRQGRHLPQG